MKQITILILVLMLISFSHGGVINSTIPSVVPGAAATWRSGTTYFETESKLIIWGFGDIQSTNDSVWERFDTHIADMTDNVPYNYAILTGDILNDGEGLPPNTEIPLTYERFKESLEESNNPFDSFYTIAGNHDYQDDGTLDNYKNVFGDSDHYYIIQGNILMIFLSHEQESNVGFISDKTFQWWKKLVGNNQDKIIIVASHYPISGVLYDFDELLMTGSQAINHSERFTDLMDGAGYEIDLWLSGHGHSDLTNAGATTSDSWEVAHNTIFIEQGHSNQPGKLHRVYTFIQDSNSVTIQTRDHTDHDYDTSSLVNVTGTWVLNHKAQFAGQTIYDSRDAVIRDDLSLGELSVNTIFDSSLIGEWLLTIDGTDTSTSDNDGALGNTVITDNVGIFNGTNARVLVSAIPDFTGESFSYSCLFRIDGGAGTQRLIMESSAASLFPINAGISTGNQLQVFTHTTAGAVNVLGTVPPVIGQWYHLSVTYTDNLLSVYLNGNFLDDVSSTGSLRDGVGLHIGSGRGALGRWFNGAIRNVRLWNRGLSAVEIAQLYEKDLFDSVNFNRLIPGVVSDVDDLDTLITALDILGLINDTRP